MRKKILYLIIFILGMVWNINYLYYTDIKEVSVIDSETKPVLNDGEVDLSLKTLEIYNGSKKIDFNFSPQILSYDIQLPDDSETNIIQIKAELVDEKAYFWQSAFGSRRVSLDYGNNKVDLIVTCDSGEKKIYSINVFRQQGLATKSRLSYLSINDKEIKLSDELEYLVVLDKNVTQTSVDARCDDKDIVVEYNNINLDYGENLLKIALVDNDNIHLYYNITIIRLNDHSYDNLQQILFKDFDFVFDINKKNYKIEYDENQDVVDDNLKIDIIPRNIKHLNIMNTKANGNKNIVVKVFNDCETLTYTFDFVKKGIEKDVEIQDNIIYYIFFIVSLVILFLSIIYSAHINKKIKSK